MNLLTIILPVWVRWLTLISAAAVFGTIVYNKGRQVEGEKHIAYLAEQSARTLKIAKAQQMVVTQTQIKYVDRIKTIIGKGETIEKQVPIYITQADNARFAVNAGFVRLYDAAWSGDDPGPAADSDREPARISLAQVAAVDASNATTCRAWRELALGLREYYAHLQAATNATKQF
ncbi:hypothetical protein [Collimonas sp. OK412]|jgi:hypothetical protein|uniref:hypothetical protein n=1 Tax=Collimonas sp. (strain OK412) TaxID=1801619 RepID=UPI0008E8D617|nr:hypothetical protein [Collimonas sp. OK412]SFB69474.1 hypothetical protein SAMN04515619_10141 [Collimonas sp. OK412]